MNSKKYQQKKNNIISEIRTTFESFQYFFEKKISITSVDFDKGRDSDDFITVQLSEKETVIKITFWINFWIGFDFEKDIALVILQSYNNKKEITNSIKYYDIKGENFANKMYSLLKEWIFEI